MSAKMHINCISASFFTLAHYYAKCVREKVKQKVEWEFFHEVKCDNKIRLGGYENISNI